MLQHRKLTLAPNQPHHRTIMHRQIDRWCGPATMLHCRNGLRSTPTRTLPASFDLAQRLPRVSRLMKLERIPNSNLPTAGSFREGSGWMTDHREFYINHGSNKFR
jgi:hypothetical protein